VTTKTSQICDGYRGKIKEGETVLLLWEGTEVFGKILKLHGKFYFCVTANHGANTKLKRKTYNGNKTCCKG